MVHVVILKWVQAFRDELRPLLERVASLLQSVEWRVADETVYSGCMQRLRMMTAIGAPPMTVLPLQTLAELGRIPRSSEGAGVEAEGLLQRSASSMKAPDDGVESSRPEFMQVSYQHSYKNVWGVCD